MQIFRIERPAGGVVRRGRRARLRLLRARVWARDAAAGDGAGTAKFDKDDPLAVEFVAAVALLRSSNYGILTQSLFDAKGMAGNIVHAVATTNAIVGGLIVVEALKVLRDARRRRDGVERDGDGDYASSADTPLPFRYTFVKQHKTNNRLLEPIEPDAPNAKCAVCGGARMELVCDADSFTLGRLVDDVLMKKLGMCAPRSKRRRRRCSCSRTTWTRTRRRCTRKTGRPRCAAPRGGRRRGDGTGRLGFLAKV